MILLIIIILLLLLWEIKRNNNICNTIIQERPRISGFSKILISELKGTLRGKTLQIAKIEIRTPRNPLKIVKCSNIWYPLYETLSLNNGVICTSNWCYRLFWFFNLILIHVMPYSFHFIFKVYKNSWTYSTSFCLNNNLI